MSYILEKLLKNPACVPGDVMCKYVSLSPVSEYHIHNNPLFVVREAFKKVINLYFKDCRVGCRYLNTRKNRTK